MKNHKQDPYVEQVEKAAAFIRTQYPKSFRPKVALTLGSGLNKLGNIMKPIATIPYADIPSFPLSTVPGHEGILITGTLEGVPVLGFKGRKHYYEVVHEKNPMEKVTFGVHVAAQLGCSLYVATNAAGGLNPKFRVGNLMVISSHIGLFLPSPLLGPHHDFGGNPLFQPQSGEYDPSLRKIFRSLSPGIYEGVYTAVTGRAYETQAECRLLRKLGADAVGMSTIPEIIVAANRGMKTFGVSLITNVIAKDGTNATNHEEVMAVLGSRKTEDTLVAVFRGFFRKLHASRGY